MTDAAYAFPAAETLRPREKRFALARKLARHNSFRIGFAILLVVLAGAAVAPLTGYSATGMSVRERFAAPSASHLFGTDMFGRDVLTRVLYGAQLSLWIGFAVTMLSGAAGAIIGIVSAQFRRLDSMLMRFMDALLAFPALLLAIGLAAALGPTTISLIIALASAYVPRTARVVRASALVIREQEFIDSARVSGAGNFRIMWRHLLPNCMAPLLVQLTFVFAYALLAEAALSFIGVGPPPPVPSWGNIISEGRDYSIEAWWIMFFPGLAISLAALGLNLVGDGMRDVLDPRLKIEN